MRHFNSLKEKVKPFVTVVDNSLLPIFGLESSIILSQIKYLLETQPDGFYEDGTPYISQPHDLFTKHLRCGKTKFFSLKKSLQEMGVLLVGKSRPRYGDQRQYNTYSICESRVNELLDEHGITSVFFLKIKAQPRLVKKREKFAKRYAQGKATGLYKVSPPESLYVVSKEPEPLVKKDPPSSQNSPRYKNKFLLEEGNNITTTTTISRTERVEENFRKTQEKEPEKMSNSTQKDQNDKWFDYFILTYAKLLPIEYKKKVVAMHQKSVQIASSKGEEPFFDRAFTSYGQIGYKPKVKVVWDSLNIDEKKMELLKTYLERRRRWIEYSINYGNMKCKPDLARHADTFLNQLDQELKRTFRFVEHKPTLESPRGKQGFGSFFNKVIENVVRNPRTNDAPPNIVRENIKKCADQGYDYLVYQEKHQQLAKEAKDKGLFPRGLLQKSEYMCQLSKVAKEFGKQAYSLKQDLKDDKLVLNKKIAELLADEVYPPTYDPNAPKPVVLADGRLVWRDAYPSPVTEKPASTEDPTPTPPQLSL